MTDDELLRAFEGCSLSFEQWTHRAHVRVAYLYSNRLDLNLAVNQMRTGITAYNKATNTPESLDRGYHETITLAFMRLVFAAARCSEPCRSSEIFCDRHPELMSKLALRRHYSTGRLMTMKAKAEFVTPDLAPLPLALNDSTIIWNVTDGEHLRVVRELLQEYAHSLDFKLCFQNFKAELAGLPGDYSLPMGRLMLAMKGTNPAGCVAMRDLGNGICEMKRLWVAEIYRGEGLGRRLATAIIEEGRDLGYKVIRLDTVPSMKAATSLYGSLGFRQIPPYRDNPISGAVFMEFELSPGASTKGKQ